MNIEKLTIPHKDILSEILKCDKKCDKKTYGTILEFYTPHYGGLIPCTVDKLKFPNGSKAKFYYTLSTDKDCDITIDNDAVMSPIIPSIINTFFKIDQSIPINIRIMDATIIITVTDNIYDDCNELSYKWSKIHPLEPDFDEKEVCQKIKSLIGTFKLLHKEYYGGN